jgi:hypothetical protein
MNFGMMVLRETLFARRLAAASVACHIQQPLQDRRGVTEGTPDVIVQGSEGDESAPLPPSTRC